MLVIDDLQWADASSLDLLAFLISGFRDQQLAVVATVRDEDRPESHRLTSWLAEVRRMPSVEEMHLERLGPEGTAAQVAALTGDDFVAFAVSPQDPMSVLFAEVFDAGAGHFEDPQAEESEHDDQGEVVGVR